MKVEHWSIVCAVDTENDHLTHVLHSFCKCSKEDRGKMLRRMLDLVYKNLYRLPCKRKTNSVFVSYDRVPTNWYRDRLGSANMHKILHTKLMLAEKSFSFILEAAYADVRVTAHRFGVIRCI